VVPRYVPVLPVRSGEVLGLHDLDEDVRSRTVPLFVVLPAVPRRQDEALAEAVALIAKSGARPAFVDVRVPADRSAAHPVTRLSELARSRRLPLVPVTWAGAPPGRQEAVRAAAARDGLGACLRTSLAAAPRLASGAVLDRLGLPPAEVDLVVDLRGAAPALDAVPMPGEWRSLTVAGASFPPSGLLGVGLTEWPRSDWAAYEQLWASGPVGLRRPDFADHGVTHRDALAASHATDVRATLRYSTPDRWLVARGGLYRSASGRSLGGDAVRPLARLLRDHPDLDRAHHCGMERWLVLVACSGTPGGDPKTWHRYATQHHVVRVTDQLRRLAVPAVPQDLRGPG
jgi:hypothetical protein